MAENDPKTNETQATKTASNDQEVTPKPKRAYTRRKTSTTGSAKKTTRLTAAQKRAQEILVYQQQIEAQKLIIEALNEELAMLKADKDMSKIEKKIDQIITSLNAEKKVKSKKKKDTDKPVKKKNKSKK